jgi:small subunit ribosomal protein S20
MALIKSAKKAIRQSARKRVQNLRRSRAIHDTVKAARGTKGMDRKQQDEALRVAYQAIDKALKRGVIKKNTAARKKSRLVKLLKKGGK